MNKYNASIEIEYHDILIFKNGELWKILKFEPELQSFLYVVLECIYLYERNRSMFILNDKIVNFDYLDFMSFVNYDPSTKKKKFQEEKFKKTWDNLKNIVSAAF